MEEGLERIVGEVLGSEICHELLRVLWDSSSSRNSSSKPKCSATSGAFGHGLFRVRQNTPSGEGNDNSATKLFY
jgi:hypothetical protein